jgi:hypothetical protein
MLKYLQKENEVEASVIERKFDGAAAGELDRGIPNMRLSQHPGGEVQGDGAIGGEALRQPTRDVPLATSDFQNPCGPRMGKQLR